VQRGKKRETSKETGTKRPEKRKKKCLHARLEKTFGLLEKGEEEKKKQFKKKGLGGCVRMRTKSKPFSPE